MFWPSKKRAKKKAEKAAKKKAEHSKKIREEAMANVSAARAHIGEDTLDRIAEIMEQKKKNSAMEKAKAQIQEADPDKVLDELKWMLDNRDA